VRQHLSCWSLPSSLIPAHPSRVQQGLPGSMGASLYPFGTTHASCTPALLSCWQLESLAGFSGPAVAA
jgi:hypothetical protein